jgi:hypothetical protein
MPATYRPSRHLFAVATILMDPTAVALWPVATLRRLYRRVIKLLRHYLNQPPGVLTPIARRQRRGIARMLRVLQSRQRAVLWQANLSQRPKARRRTTAQWLTSSPHPHERERSPHPHRSRTAQPVVYSPQRPAAAEAQWGSPYPDEISAAAAYPDEVPTAARSATGPEPIGPTTDLAATPYPDEVPTAARSATGPEPIGPTTDLAATPYPDEVPTAIWYPDEISAAALTAATPVVAAWATVPEAPRPTTDSAAVMSVQISKVVRSATVTKTIPSAAFVGVQRTQKLHDSAPSPQHWTPATRNLWWDRYLRWGNIRSAAGYHTLVYQATNCQIDITWSQLGDQNNYSHAHYIAVCQGRDLCGFGAVIARARPPPYAEVAA